MSKLAGEMRPVTGCAIAGLLSNVRTEDVLEFEAVLGRPVADELQYAVDHSEECRAFVIHGEVVAIFGCIRYDDRIGVPWLISTYAVNRHKRAFLERCRAEVAMMRKRHCALINYTDARYTLALRWMRWMGFEQQDAVPYGVNGELFHPFTMRGEQWAQQQSQQA